MEDRMAFALVNIYLAAYICQAHFKVGALPKAKQNSGPLFYRWNDGFINRIRLLIVLCTAYPCMHEKGPCGGESGCSIGLFSPWL
jgi:hypothetical protein